MAYQVFIDGFDRTPFLSKWHSYSGVSHNLTSGRRDTPCVERSLGTGSGDYLRTRTFSESTYAAVGFAFNLLGEEQNIRIELGKEWVPQSYVHITNLGLYSIYNGSGELIWVASEEFLLDTWNYLEFGVKCASDGFFEIRLNGQTVSNTSANTISVIGSGVDTLNISFPGEGIKGMLMDDLYVSYGSELRFFGDCRVDTYDLTANSTPMQWTPDANNTSIPPDQIYTLLNQEANSIISINENTEALFEANNIIHRPYRIHSVQVVGDVKKSDAGTAIFSLEMKSQGQTHYGTQIALPSSRTTYWFTQNLEPTSSSIWNMTSVNNLKVGVKAWTV